MFSSLDTSIQHFWLWRKRQMICMWCLQYSFGDASPAYCGGCVLGCSVRKQGMVMNTPRHRVVKIQAISSCEQVFPHQAKLYFEILCLAPSGIAPRTSSVFSKGSPAKRDGGRRDTGKEQPHHHCFYVAGKGGQVCWEPCAAVGVGS